MVLKQLREGKNGRSLILNRCPVFLIFIVFWRFSPRWHLYCLKGGIMIDLTLPPMTKTAAFMRRMGYSERSIAEITGLSRYELSRAYIMSGREQPVRPDQWARAPEVRVRQERKRLQG